MILTLDMGVTFVSSLAEHVFKDSALRQWKRSVLSRTFVQGDTQVDARVVYLYANNHAEIQSDSETKPEVGNDTESPLETVVYYLGVSISFE